MLKRSIVFVSYFLIFKFYIETSGFLALRGNSLLFIGFEVFLALGIYIVSKKLNLFEIRKFTTKDWLIYLSGFVAYLFSLGVIEFIPIHSGSVRFVSETNFYSPIYFTYLCIFGPLMEELTSRGLVQKGVFNNSYLGLVMSATLFSLVHKPEDFWSFIPYFLTGLIFGYMDKRADQLGPSILLHMTVNSLTLFR